MEQYIQRLQEAIASSLRGISHEDLMRYPEGKWSIAEVLEHLYLTYTGTVKGCERCLEKGKPQVRPPTAVQQMKAFVVITIGYFPPGIKAPAVAIPRGMPVEQVLEDIVPRIGAMGELITLCETRFGKQTQFLEHPVMGTLTASQWRKFHWVHGWHHVKQVLRLRQAAS